jgi:2',3'-cyclic-nucleotide 2'-phosphodiesterase (5'-nucleotidase family)
MVDWYANNVNSGEFWTDASIAILQGGGIRSSIDTARNITMEDLLTIMPFGAKLEVAEITGSELMEVLEHSVHRYDNGDENGEFLQFSGLNVIYDLSQPVGKRVADVKVVCAKCVIPTLVSVNLTEKYKIIIVDFLANGGDGYKTFIGKSVFKAEVSDIDFFSAYLLKKSPVFPAIEWRIKFIEHDETEVLGMTKVKLDNNCKTQECNFGNFIADSMVDNYVQNYDKDGNWTDVSIALIQGKKITSSIPANSNITRSDINSIFESKYLQVKELTGLELKNILMYGVKNDQLLQVSGLEVKIDMNKPENQEITDLRALCTGCLFPEYETVINNRHYKVIMQKSLASGEDGFGAIYENSNTEQINEYDTNAFMSYLKKKSPIYPAVEDRIIIIEKIVSPTGEPTTSSSTTTDSTTTTTEGGSSNLVMSFTVLIFSMILSFQINL